MPKKKTLRIALLGLGTVGQGVWKHIRNNRKALEARLGAGLELYAAGVRDLKKKRRVSIPASRMTTDLDGLAEDPRVDIFCELMGGTGRARELTLKALRNGKIVVSANKALICEHGAELFEAARKGGGHFFFEASVAGGIPIIKTLYEGLVANRFPLIFGILNGTSNYILTRMEREGLSFEETVGAARELGYVEADESLDLDGWDAAHKAVVLAFLAHGLWVPTKQLFVNGIRNVTTEDIETARELGYKIKLIASIRRDFDSESLVVLVQPSLIPEKEIVAGVDDVFNAVSVSGDVVGTTVLIGRGAGQDATASAVIGDIADAVQLLVGQEAGTASVEAGSIYRPVATRDLSVAGKEAVRGRFYIRLTVEDRPGVLAKIADVMARNNVSLATVHQHPREVDQAASLILTTHRTDLASVDKTLMALRRLKTVREQPVLLHIFEPETA
ncbi:MAG: homoserine dehydrogenase [Opitutales bacterium]